MRYILKAESDDKRGARRKLYCIIAGSAVFLDGTEQLNSLSEFQNLQQQLARIPAEPHLGNGIILSNHYRCAPPVIQFCSPNYPGGLQILSDYNGEAKVKHLLAYHVEGSHLNHTNPEEIDGQPARFYFPVITY